MGMTEIFRNLMLTIDQISQITGVHKSTLRHWEKSFDGFLKPSRTQSNRRKYSLEDLDRVKAIKYLLEHEHLTAYGVRLRLQEIFSPEGQKETGPRARPDLGQQRPSSSMAGKDSPIQ